VDTLRSELLGLTEELLEPHAGGRSMRPGAAGPPSAFEAAGAQPNLFGSWDGPLSAAGWAAEAWPSGSLAPAPLPYGGSVGAQAAPLPLLAPPLPGAEGSSGPPRTAARQLFPPPSLEPLPGGLPTVHSQPLAGRMAGSLPSVTAPQLGPRPAVSSTSVAHTVPALPAAGWPPARQLLPGGGEEAAEDGEEVHGPVGSHRGRPSVPGALMQGYMPPGAPRPGAMPGPPPPMAYYPGPYGVPPYPYYAPHMPYHPMYRAPPPHGMGAYPAAAYGGLRCTDGVREI
jgi:hypothetical protein